MYNNLCKRFLKRKIVEEAKLNSEIIRGIGF